MNTLYLPTNADRQWAAGTLYPYFKEIIERVLPNFWYHINETTFLSEPCTYISIAANSHRINGVSGQLPQIVTRIFSRGELIANGRAVYREPNIWAPDEKYLWGKGMRVPFRKSKDYLGSFERFCIAYKKILVDNMGVLKYQDVVDYKTLLK